MKFPSISRLLFAVCLLALSLTPPCFATDLTITSTSVTPGANAVIREAFAGAAITAGKVVYKSSTDGKLYLADGDSATATVRDAVGIAIVTGAIGSKIAYVIEDDDLTIGATVANGTVYVLSATAGGIAPVADLTTGWYPTVIAVGKSSTKIAFKARPIRSATAL
ncbi:hypothetical protein [Prosthecobacter sp.]|jgi:hypothetical protein|uniref:hypothetical protein n=1 Tax=Prosthecobacter sp. TaxID=1965333 RepID=UPI0037C92422